MANLREASAELSSRLASQMRLAWMPGLNQKVCGQDEGLENSFVADDAPPADRRSLTRSDTLEERGKPVVPLPPGRQRAVRSAYGNSRQRNGRKSECRLVMIRIEGAFFSRTTSPHAQALLTSSAVFYHERALTN